MKRKAEPEAVANAPLKLTAVFKARKADSAAPKLEPKPRLRFQLLSGS